jgi:16S rRNA (uracil1498-N3)-methyltransferase
LLESQDLSKVDAVVEPLFFSAIGEDTTVGSSFVLAGAEAKHAVSVRRMTPGEQVSVSDGQGKRIRGKVSKVSKDTLELLVESVEKIMAPENQLVLVQALAKGDRDELAIQACTELGVSSVVPWQAERSVSIWKDDKKLKGQLRWQTIVSEAAKQSLRAFVPTVESVRDTHELVEYLGQFDQVLILVPQSAKSITEVALKPSSKTAIVVGPEGGISEPELALFDKAGFSSVHLGAGVLRTSTAGMAAVSYLQAKLGDWS